jgi:hypothetical protein
MIVRNKLISWPVALLILSMVSSFALADLKEINWGKSGFDLTHHFRFQPGRSQNQTAILKKIDLQVLIFEGTDWSELNSKELIQGAAEVYAQCGIAVNEAHFYFVRPKNSRLDYNEFATEGEDSLLALRASTPGEINGLTIYLFRSLLDRPGSAGFSRAKWNESYDINAKLFDTIYLTQVALSKEYLEERKDSQYNLLAHEMLHVLTRRGGHFNSVPKNLFNIWSTRTNLILKNHCEEALANPLLF